MQIYSIYIIYVSQSIIKSLILYYYDHLQHFNYVVYIRLLYVTSREK